MSENRVEKIVLLVQEGCPYCKEALTQHRESVDRNDIVVRDASKDRTTYEFAMALGINSVPEAVKITVEDGQVQICRLDPFTLKQKECLVSPFKDKRGD